MQCGEELDQGGSQRGIEGVNGAVAFGHGVAFLVPHPNLDRCFADGVGLVAILVLLSSMSLVYASYFLVQVADLRPTLAGLVPLIGRGVDAITDPLMGEISDRTRWK